MWSLSPLVCQSLAGLVVHQNIESKRSAAHAQFMAKLHWTSGSECGRKKSPLLKFCLRFRRLTTCPKSDCVGPSKDCFREEQSGHCFRILTLGLQTFLKSLRFSSRLTVPSKIQEGNSDKSCSRSSSFSLPSGIAAHFENKLLLMTAITDSGAAEPQLT